MIRLTSKEIIKNLIDIGYTLSEISKYTTISRSTLSNILKNGTESNVVVTSKLENFFKANIEEVELGYFADVKNRTTSLIYTPDGFQKAIGFIDKGVLHCYSIKTENREIIAADEHLIQLADNSWIKVNLLSIGSKLLTESGIEEIISIEDAGNINCYDITIDHKNHRYFIDGISSHNTGKSKIAASIAANALNECNYDAIFYFDSEGGGLKEFFENCGCDTDKVFQILVSSVEDAQLQILKTYSQIEEFKKEDPDVKFLCILDSLGALVPEKLLRDANNDKVASEMGNRAKLINNMMKAITIPALKTDTTMIVLNHIYQNPGALFASKIQNQGGGLGLQYMGTVNIQCTRVLEKDDAKDKDAYYSGTNLNFFTIKNRICRPSLETRIYLDFKKGFVNPYDGLFDEAVRYGFITCPSQGYFSVPSCSNPDKKWRRAQIEANKEIWDTFIKEFDEKSQQDLKYSKAAKDAIDNQDSIDEIAEKTVENIDLSQIDLDNN